MTIESTAAKIGRSMKKCEMFTARRSRHGPTCGVRRSPRWARCWRFAAAALLSIGRSSGATIVPGARAGCRDDDAIVGAEALAHDAQAVDAAARA